MRVAVLALGDVFDLGLSSVLDTLGTANDLSERAPFKIELVGVRRRVRSHRGMSVPVVPPGRRAPDAVIVPALGAKDPESLCAALERRDVADACALLQRWRDAGALVSAACTATFVLARSGLLDDLAATTTWWLGPLFRKLFPSVRLDESRMLVANPSVVTAGAALSHIDLGLWFIRRQSPELAALTARYLVIDPRPSQSAYAIADHLMHSDPVVARFEAWARENLTDFSLDHAARGVGTSPRTLERKLQSVLGKSPLSFVQDLRIERAIHLLRTSDDSVDAIAGRVGYGDGVTLRTLLRRKTGRGVRDLRVKE